jgi:Spy/CpxP family protein refolding chaperone
MRTSLRSIVFIGSVALATAPLHAALADVQTSQSALQPKQSAVSEANDIVQLFDEALSNMALRPEQSDMLQKVGAEVDAKVGAVDQAKRDFMVALSKEIETGSVDSSTLHASLEEVVDAAAAASPILRAGFEKLHDTLDPEQRKQFVAGLRDALKKRAGMLDPKAQLDEWSKTLNLTDEQKQKIGAIMSSDTVDNDVARARIRLILAAFPGDKLSLDEIVPANTAHERTEKMFDHIVDVAKEVTDVLTPEQRALAANAIRNATSSQPPSPTTSEPSASNEGTGTVAQALWAGGGRYYAGGYRSFGGYGFSRGYATGFGGMYMF